MDRAGSGHAIRPGSLPIESTTNSTGLTICQLFAERAQHHPAYLLLPVETPFQFPVNSRGARKLAVPLPPSK